MSESPYIGQMVHYFPGDTDYGALAVGHSATDPIAAVVTNVWDHNTVNLRILRDGTNTDNREWRSAVPRWTPDDASYQRSRWDFIPEQPISEPIDGCHEEPVECYEKSDVPSAVPEVEEWECTGMRVHTFTTRSNDVSVLLLRLVDWLDAAGDGTPALSGIDLSYEDEAWSLTVTYAP